MARILLKVSGNTGRPHPRLLYRESCEGAAKSPDQYGSGTQRASDYGDLIKGSPQCQPMPLRPHPRRRGSLCLQVIPQRPNLAVSVRAAPAIPMRKSVVARSAHPAGAALRFGVSPLIRDQVELLLRLIQAQTDALLVEQPEVAADGCVDQPQLVELTAELANAKSQLTVGFAEIVDPFG